MKKYRFWLCCSFVFCSVIFYLSVNRSLFFKEISLNYFLLSEIPIEKIENWQQIQNPSGKILFEFNCSACHLGGENLIIPEKTLNQETLKANGFTTSYGIQYQIRNGKNGMPAFGGRLKENEIREILKFLLHNTK